MGPQRMLQALNGLSQLPARVRGPGQGTSCLHLCTFCGTYSPTMGHEALRQAEYICSCFPGSQSAAHMGASLQGLT